MRTINNRFWRKKKVLVTGGAGFIGSHMVSTLIRLGSRVTIFDNLSSGSLANLKEVKGYKFINGDAHDFQLVKKAVRGHDTVIHLAATIGGRGYIDTHPADCCSNFSINDNVIRASYLEKVNKIVYASTACVYPLDLQKKYNSKYLLKEEDAFKNGWANCDVEYGWAKFMGEMELKAYYKQYGLKSVSVRYLTAYGPREDDTHAIMALIKRALDKQDPYIIWGTGEEDRGFTYIDDIIKGTLLAAETIDDGSAINVGVEQRYKIKNAAQLIYKITGFKPHRIIYDSSRPKGVISRALNMRRTRKLLDWYPEITFETGLKKTIEWMKKHRISSRETIR